MEENFIIFHIYIYIRYYITKFNYSIARLKMDFCISISFVSCFPVLVSSHCFPNRMHKNGNDISLVFPIFRHGESSKKE